MSPKYPDIYLFCFEITFRLNSAIFQLFPLGYSCYNTHIFPPQTKYQLKFSASVGSFQCLTSIFLFPFLICSQFRICTSDRSFLLTAFVNQSVGFLRQSFSSSIFALPTSYFIYLLLYSFSSLILKSSQ